MIFDIGATRTRNDHQLDGCAPIPLAGYLKALGVFRLVAEQSDPEASGFWRNERFVLRTALSESQLIDFFTTAYRPTPIVAPWNGGSGFWPKDQKAGIEAIASSPDPRLRLYAKTIALGREMVGSRALSEAPKGAAKGALVGELRGRLAPEAFRWLDGAVALTSGGPKYPPILGTGGNDGRFDFSNNFMQRVAELMVADPERSAADLEIALFSRPGLTSGGAIVGQFAPGAAGGANSGVGFEGEAQTNGWAFVLMIEGALAFASAAVRRLGEDSIASFTYPFTTRTVGAGSGAAGFEDESDSRGEFWAPLWSRPAGLGEILLLMSEGRAVLGGRAARDGLDFARAAGQLGVSRGIDSFQRHAFLMRSGRAFFATPLGRVRVRSRPTGGLLTQLDRTGWLTRVRRAVRDQNAPGSLKRLGRQLDDSLFALAGSDSPQTVQSVLIAIGELVILAAQRPKLHDPSATGMIPPIPHLGSEWATKADDGSMEFALAAALASLDATGRVPGSNVDTAGTFRLPFRRHLGPLEVKEFSDAWSGNGESQVLAVWTGRGLARDMGAVLERRLVEAQRRTFEHTNEMELPLRGLRTAPLAAVAAFLDEDTDDELISRLVAGLAWTRGGRVTGAQGQREAIVPLAYAAIKPLVSRRIVLPDERADSLDMSPDSTVDPTHPLPIVRLIEADRVPDALRLAGMMARGVGFPVCFPDTRNAMPTDPRRLLAALLFPMSTRALKTLADRAYPDLNKQENDTNAA